MFLFLTLRTLSPAIRALSSSTSASSNRWCGLWRIPNRFLSGQGHSGFNFDFSFDFEFRFNFSSAARLLGSAEPGTEPGAEIESPKKLSRIHGTVLTALRPSQRVGRLYSLNYLLFIFISDSRRCISLPPVQTLNSPNRSARGCIYSF